MPSKIKYPCKVYRCPNFVFKNGMCEFHLKKDNEMRNDFDNVGILNFYNSTVWRKLRAWYIRNNPLCIMCSEQGSVVDHIKPIRQGGALCEVENLQTMCEKHHNIKRAEEKKLYD